MPAPQITKPLVTNSKSQITKQMKKIFLSAALLSCISAASFAQNYMTRTGKVYFNATTKSSPEKIEAVNNETACLLMPAIGDVRFQVPVKSFKFEKQLMQDHFNENYMESDKYPKADFAGKITNLSEINFSKDGTYNAKVAGKLTIHGVAKDVNENGTITIKGNTAKLAAKFSVLMADYKINIPRVVEDKVDKSATISFEGELTKK